MRTKVRGKYVIGFLKSDHAIYEDGEVVFENDKIIFVGHNFPHEVHCEIDSGNSVVSPGFIDLNALGDIDHAILDYEDTDDLRKGHLWSERYVSNGPYEVLSPEYLKLSSTYALCYLIMSGITTALPITSLLYRSWSQTYNEFASMMDVIEALGIRIYMAPSYRSGVRVIDEKGRSKIHWDTPRGDRGLEDAFKFITEFDGSNEGLIRGLLAPGRIEECDKELLTRTIECSQKLGCPVRIHAAQNLHEVDLILGQYGQTPIQYLSKIGFLGPQILIAHAIYYGGHSHLNLPFDLDLDLLSKSGTSIIHCPLIKGRHGVALESFDKYRSAGINIGLGTDTFPPDMFRVMDLGSMLGKIVENDNSSNTANDFFRAATLGGANALGRQDIGRLSPGAKADIVIIDLNDWGVGIVDDPIKTLILNVSRHNIKTVIINGRIVMKDGQIPGFDVLELKRQGQIIFGMMKRAFMERDYKKRSMNELFPPSFPIIRKQET